MVCCHFNPSSNVLLERFPKSFFSSPTCASCSKKGEVWVCLTDSCGFSGCGRLENAHMLDHFERTDHCVVLNVKSAMVWCYKCDDSVSSASVDALRKYLNSLFEAPKRKSTISVVSGTRGIMNIGNTCFLAASMQALSHTPLFQETMRSSSVYSDTQLAEPLTGKQRLVIAVRNFLLAQWEPNPQSGQPIDPDEILTSVQRLNALFQGYHQHDSQELLRFVLSTMHEELRPKKDEESIVSRIFGGKTCSTVTCLKCNKESTCIEPFFDLSLPIPAEPFSPEMTERILGSFSCESIKSESTSMSSWLWSKTKSALGLVPESKVSLSDCLVQFMRTEKLTGVNAYLCEHCKVKTDCLKRMSIRALPEVLVIHLKRFRHDWGSSKLSKVVTIPLEDDLDVSAFVDSPTGGTKYRLCSFVQHVGSIGSGHYVAYGKHKVNKQWFLFDDSRVSLLTSISDQTEAYVLFFQRVQPS